MPPPPTVFWNWFSRNADRIRRELQTNTQAISREIGKALKQYHADLVWEIGPIEGDTWDFCISADGQGELFPAVIELVEAAPEVPGWHIRAFRQRGRIEDVTVEMGEARLGPEDIYFTAEAVEGGLGLTLWIRGLNRSNDPVLSRAALILLDNALGEYDAVTMIAELNRGPLPDNPEAEAGLYPFHQLPEFIDSLKAQQEEE